MEIFYSFLIGFISAYISKFIDFCFNDGNILDFYYKWLLMLKNKYPKLSKPLGLCIFCMSFWVCLIMFMIFYNEYNLTYKDFFISIAVNYAILFKTEN
jgi:hypothetical protein